MANLYPHQAKAVVATRAWLAMPDKTGAHIQPTGAGKSIIMSAIAHDTHKKMLVIVHRVKLVNQLQNSFILDGIQTAVEQAEQTFTTAQVCVASLDTLYDKNLARLNKLLTVFNPALIVVDEAHHRYSDDREKYTKVLERIQAVRPDVKELNFTATDYIEDPRQRLQMGTVISRESLQDIVREGFLCEYDYAAVPPVVDALNNVNVADTILRDNPTLSQKRTLIYMPDAVSATILPVALKKHGLIFVPCTSELPSDLKMCEKVWDTHISTKYTEFYQKARKINRALTREQAYFEYIKLALTNKQIDGICNYDILSEGTDIPAVDNVLNFRPLVERPYKLGQMIGRSTRLSPQTDKHLSTIRDYTATLTPMAHMMVPSHIELLRRLAQKPINTPMHQVVIETFKKDGQAISEQDWKQIHPAWETKTTCTLTDNFEYPSLAAASGYPSAVHMFANLNKHGITLNTLQHIKYTIRQWERIIQRWSDLEQSKDTAEILAFQLLTGKVQITATQLSNTLNGQPVTVFSNNQVLGAICGKEVYSASGIRKPELVAHESKCRAYTTIEKYFAFGPVCSSMQISDGNIRALYGMTNPALQQLLLQELTLRPKLQKFPNLPPEVLGKKPQDTSMSLG